MKKKITLIFPIGIIMILIFIYFLFFGDATNKLIFEANNQYSIAEKSTNIKKRENAFNRALENYLYLEKKYEPINGNGILYYDIANCYFQLSQYPQAALFYYRALFLRPLDENVRENLNMTLNKLHLSPLNNFSFINDILFFHYFFSIPQKLQIFFFLILIFLIFLSFYIWFPSTIKKLGAITFFLLSFTFYLSLMFSYVFEYSEGVLMHATYLYKGEGVQFTKVYENPLLAGLKVRIIESNKKGSWIKIKDDNGNIGFIETEAIKLIF